MGVQNEHREWVERTNNLTIEVFSITLGYSQPQTAYDDFTSAITNSRKKILRESGSWRFENMEREQVSSYPVLARTKASVGYQERKVDGGNKFGWLGSKRASYFNPGRGKLCVASKETSMQFSNISQLPSLYFVCAIRTTCLICSQKMIRRARFHGPYHQSLPESEALLKRHRHQTRRGVDFPWP